MKIMRINLRKSVICFLSMFCLLSVLPINNVSAQEETSGGAKLKSENDFFEILEHKIPPFILLFC